MPTTNPFLCPPKKHRRQEETRSQLQKRDNPFLSSRNNGNQNQNQNQFRNHDTPTHNNQFRTRVVNNDVDDGNNVIAKPLSFEESFPSLSKCNQSSGGIAFAPTKLNFKCAIQHSSQQDQSPATHTQSPATHTQSPATQSRPHQSPRNNQTTTQFLRGNVFLCPPRKCSNQYGMDDDHNHDHDTQDAYDSAYTNYYNDY